MPKAFDRWRIPSTKPFLQKSPLTPERPTDLRFKMWYLGRIRKQIANIVQITLYISE